MIEHDGLKFKTEPWPHQLAALKYLMGKRAAALYTDCGSGKTKIMIDMIMNKGLKRVLIVTTNKSCSVWLEEIALHGYSKRVHPVPLFDTEIVKRVSSLKEYEIKGSRVNQKGSLIFIINYEAVWRTKIARVLLHKRLGIDCVICDESHRIKSPGSKCSRFLTNIGKIVDYRYLMTGTPLAENPMDVYAQYRFLDPTIFGTSITRMRARYENVDLARSSKVMYTILDKNEPYIHLDELRKKMFSIAFQMDSTVKLPPTTSVIRSFFLSSKTEQLYRNLYKDGAIQYSEIEVLETSNVVSKIIRLQQLTSGYLALENLETKEKRLQPISKSRLDLLEGLLDEIPQSEPVVIFAKFTKDLKGIQGLCESKGIKYSELSGKADQQAEWKAGKTQVLGVQYQSGSESVSFTRARYCIYYSLTHSLSLFYQSKKRVHRPGQKHPVTYYYLVGKIKGKKTIDEDILDCLKRKQDIIQYVMKKTGS